MILPHSRISQFFRQKDLLNLSFSIQTGIPKFTQLFHTNPICRDYSAPSHVSRCHSCDSSVRQTRNTRVQGESDRLWSDASVTDATGTLYPVTYRRVCYSKNPLRLKNPRINENCGARAQILVIRSLFSFPLLVTRTLRYFTTSLCSLSFLFVC